MTQSKVAFLGFILLFLSSCGGKQKKETPEKRPLDSRTKIRLKQYKIQGAKIYATHCGNCHRKDGKGLASLYPPLARSDYLMEDFSRAACIIKHGQAKKIVVNGVEYNQMMPANPMTPLEIAEVLTFIGNSWGNTAGLIPVKEVDRWLDDCKDY